MPTTDFSSSTEKYLFSRTVFREQAKEQFYTRRPKIVHLISAANEYVAKTMLSLSGQDMREVPHGLYIGDLTVSFTRTHFVIVDLVVCSELIDAATLLRKQFELLARLNELHTSDSIDHLLKRTPSLSALKTQLRGLYGEYSKVAHSSSPQPLELLGRIEHKGKTRTVVYPEFQENAYVSLQHVVLTIFEYFIWANQFMLTYNDKYDSGWADEWQIDTLRQYEAIFEAS